MLQKLIKIYSVDTGNFYSNQEARLHWKLHMLKIEKRNLKDQESEIINLLMIRHGIGENFLKEAKANKLDYSDISETAREKIEEYLKLNKYISLKTNLIKQVKDKLLKKLSVKVDDGKLRVLRNLHPAGSKDSIFADVDRPLPESKQINVFDSSFTRMIGAEENELCDDFLVVQIYYFDIAKDIIQNGFIFQNEKYIYFTSSAGQIRQKKAVFIKESTWEEYMPAIMNGLTIEKINQAGGANPNKFLAYMALSMSATDEWEEFDIDKAIVINDFETNVYGEYDFIDETDYSITRMKGEIPIPHTDGCGMMLPKMGNTRMIRLPWVKGLLCSFDFAAFIKEKGCSPLIKDIYGIEHDVIAEDIEIILTKSQFKMHKFYSSFEEYQRNFKYYGCRAGYTNVEEDNIGNATINYQMLQSLTDVTEKEIQHLAEKSNQILKGMNTYEGIRKVFGCTPYNNHKTSLQKAIMLYPNLVNDGYLKEKLRAVKNSLIQKYRSGSLAVDGKYTFLLPDFYAACQYWFQGIQKPEGLLKDGEVYCRLFPSKEKLDCLRSPHLYREHAVRKNVAEKKDPEIDKWFCTNGLYTSSKDLITKILMNDVDGDKALVVSDSTLIAVAERNLKDVVPLYYNMKKAPSIELTSSSLYHGLNASFVSGNIGLYSNNISKIWNNPVFQNGKDYQKQEALDAIKLLCAEDNFNIDSAKTLYMPVRPDWFAKRVSKYTNKKVPHFFVYAKDKLSGQVEKKQLGIVDKLEGIIKKEKLNFKMLQIEKPDYKVLLSKGDSVCVENSISSDLILKYSELNRKYHFKLSSKCIEVSNNLFTNTKLRQDVFFNDIAKEIKMELSQTGLSDIEITDILVKHLYHDTNSNHKDLLWFCYGDIILNNLEKNIKPQDKIVKCVDCGELFYVPKKNTKTCRCSLCYSKYRELYKKTKKGTDQNGEKKEL